MKVVILCGGYGSRLSAAHPELPKPLVPIGGKPILWHLMRGFAARGFREFVLCLGYRSELFKQYFLDLPRMLEDVTIDGPSRRIEGASDSEEARWTITLAETGLGAQTGHRVRRAAAYVPPSDEHFIVTYGDGVSDVDMAEVVAFHKAHGRLATVTAVHPPGRFGELAIEDASRVTEFNEKPQASAGWISGGFFVFSRAFLDRLPPNADLVLESEPLRSLAREGQLMAYRHDGFWFCMDTPRDLRQLEEMWEQGRPPWAVWNAP